ncbi:MAG TPA: GH92 family glycosyl hydrolase [Pyrinomonadaceae bacterium]|jgi:predicted alpha-1,2-mannosidase|nr:GH92 family glycosyl hydrolase [Pyrinomonadaceae bacterium]
MNKKFRSIFLSAMLAAALFPVRPVEAQRADLSSFVNPFVGTGNSPLPDYLGGNASGNTFPGATLPFGMVQFSPDTDKSFGPVDRGSYAYHHDSIRGFSLTHLSGPGCPIFGDVPIMPVAGGVKSSPATDPGAYVSKFSHDGESASPGFYEVALDSGVKVSLTATLRTGFGVFAFPRGKAASLLFNVGRNATGVQEGEWRVEGDRQLTGSVASGGFCGARNRYVLYFAAEFDRPFASFGVWEGDRVMPGVSPVKGKQVGGFVTFDERGDTVRMKVGVSYVSVENARLNLRAENAGWDFEAVRAAARARWNDALARLEARGGTPQERRVFYTALYHALLHPTTFSDSNGEYLGFDERVHRSPAHTQYSNFSGWDIYRSQIPLVALLFPEEASDMMQSLVTDAEQGGGLPLWPVANDESGAMVGDPSTAGIASAYALGARRFDTRAALRAMLRNATDPEARSRSYPARSALADYMKLGYIPMEQKGLRGSPSVALEYETADFALAQFAKAQGDLKTHREMMRRSQWWTRLFDPEHKYIRGRWRDGSWLPGFDFKAMLYKPELPWRYDSHKSYVEGNAAQYTWMVPHNLRGLFDRIGGDEAVIKRLDAFFTEFNAGPDRPHFFIGNEPVFPVPWAYNHAGQPWKTQAVTRRVLTELFADAPGGIPGNDDLGATSSWVVFAALGLYPTIPGVGGFSLNSPLFPEINVRAGRTGTTLKIVADGASARTPYVHELRLNGKPHESTWLPFPLIERGATLHFKLGPEPNRTWATHPSARPPSFNDGMEEAPDKKNRD